MEEVKLSFIDDVLVNDLVKTKAILNEVELEEMLNYQINSKNLIKKIRHIVLTFDKNTNIELYVLLYFCIFMDDCGVKDSCIYSNINYKLREFCESETVNETNYKSEELTKKTLENIKRVVYFLSICNKLELYKTKFSELITSTLKHMIDVYNEEEVVYISSDFMIFLEELEKIYIKKAFGFEINDLIKDEKHKHGFGNKKYDFYELEDQNRKEISLNCKMAHAKMGNASQINKSSKRSRVDMEKRKAEEKHKADEKKKASNERRVLEKKKKMEEKNKKIEEKKKKDIIKKKNELKAKKKKELEKIKHEKAIKLKNEKEKKRKENILKKEKEKKEELLRKEKKEKKEKEKKEIFQNASNIIQQSTIPLTTPIVDNGIVNQPYLNSNINTPNNYPVLTSNTIPISNQIADTSINQSDTSYDNSVASNTINEENEQKKVNKNDDETDENFHIKLAEASKSFATLEDFFNEYNN